MDQKTIDNIIITALFLLIPYGFWWLFHYKEWKELKKDNPLYTFDDYFKDRESDNDGGPYMEC